MVKTDRLSFKLKGNQADTVYFKLTWRLADKKFRNSPIAKPSICMTGLSQSQAVNPRFDLLIYQFF